MFFRITPVVKNLIILNVVMFIGKWMLQSSNISFNFAMFSPVLDSLLPDYDLFKPYQILSSIFSHAGVNHLFFNMLSLFFLGTMLEDRIDSKSFGIIYLASAFGGMIINELINLLIVYGSVDLPPAGWVLGASGAVAGVIAALATHSPDQQIQLLFPPIPLKLKWLAIIFIAIDLKGGMSGMSDGIAHWVHIGGALTGFLMMKFWYFRR